MMSFLHWVCAKYLGRKRKKGGLRLLHTYWRDFKMLYRRLNGDYVDANHRHEVVKVWQPSSNVLVLQADL